jgi:hypothetical protein
MHVSFSITLERVTTPPQSKELTAVVVCAVVAVIGCAVAGCTVVAVVVCAVVAVIGCAVFVVGCAVVECGVCGGKGWCNGR